jgi:hypothetical protein
MLSGNSPDWAMQLVGSTSAALFLVAGFTVFKRLETGLADVA